jgi:two-component system phosphate regulon sensor histidine kinase PhoR
VGIALVLALGAYNLRCMARLVAWTREPVGTPVPRALGVWDYVFANLNRRTRVAYDQKERLVQTLSRFREASHAMPYGVIYLSRHNAVEWLNNGASAIFGLDETRDIGRSITNIIRQPDFVGYLEAGNYEEALVLHSMRQEGLTVSVQVVPFGAEQKMVWRTCGENSWPMCRTN